jgi:hypothetical protein
LLENQYQRRVSASCTRDPELRREEEMRRIEGIVRGVRAQSHLSALLLIVLWACTLDPSAPTSAIFVVEVVDERFRVLLTRAEVIEQARELMETGESRVLMGRLAAGDGGFNFGYDWHLEPESVGFHDAAIEVCDGLPSHVEEDVQYWLGTVGTYCPWNSRIVQEVRGEK